VAFDEFTHTMQSYTSIIAENTTLLLSHEQRPVQVHEGHDAGTRQPSGAASRRQIMALTFNLPPGWNYKAATPPCPCTSRDGFS